MKYYANHNLNIKPDIFNQPDLRLNHNIRFAVVKILNQLMVDEAFLYGETNKAQRDERCLNVPGMVTFYDVQCTQLKIISGEIVKRAQSLGINADNMDREFPIQTRLSEHSGSVSIIADLIANHQNMIRFLRQDAMICSEECSDNVTRDILLDILCSHQKMLKILDDYESAKPVSEENNPRDFIPQKTSLINKNEI